MVEIQDQGASVPDRASQASPGAAAASPSSGDYPSRGKAVVATYAVAVLGFDRVKWKYRLAIYANDASDEDAAIGKATAAFLKEYPDIPVSVALPISTDLTASAIDARSGEARQRLDPKDESAVAKPDAQPHPQPSEPHP